MRHQHLLSLAFVITLGAMLAGCGAENSGAGPADASDLQRDAGGPVEDGAFPDDAGHSADAGSPDASSPDPACEGPGGFPPPGPTDPYSSLNGLEGSSLREALHALVKDHTWLTYNDARRAIFEATKGLDVHDGLVECVYTGRSIPAAGATSNGFNVEHSWPQNEGAELEPARSDLHHLFPSDSEANLRRGSLPYAFTGCDLAGDCIWTEGGSEIGTGVGGPERVFEVRPERRGDIARAHFYFSVRYQLPIPDFEEAALRCWNWTDPPDEQELARNDAIEAIQTKRNPFVDRPDFVESVVDF